MSMRACVTCGWCGQPNRTWCPVCGHGEWFDVETMQGRVVVVTRIRRAAGVTVEPAIPVCLVELDGGEHVIAGTEEDVKEGDSVRVVRTDGALRARR